MDCLDVDDDFLKRQDSCRGARTFPYRWPSIDPIWSTVTIGYDNILKSDRMC